MEFERAKTIAALVLIVATDVLPRAIQESNAETVVLTAKLIVTISEFTDDDLEAARTAIMQDEKVQAFARLAKPKAPAIKAATAKHITTILEGLPSELAADKRQAMVDRITRAVNDPKIPEDSLHMLTRTLRKMEDDV